MKTRIPIIVGIFIVVCIAYILTHRLQNKSITVQTAKASYTTFVQDIQTSGKTKAKKEAVLRFQTSGKLSWINVKEGDSVYTGQALAGLDARDVQTSLQKALTDYAKQRNTYEETWRVTYQGRQRPSDALTDTVKRILEKNQWDLNLAVYDVELKQLAVEYATLYSPISGIVTHIDSPVAGVNITPSTSTIAVIDPASIVFEANIDETDVGSLLLGQSAILHLDAYPQASFSAQINYISFSSSLSPGGATVFPVELTIDTTTPLRVGLNGDISIILREEKNVLTVPIEAIRDDIKGKYVIVNSKSTYSKKYITVSLSNDTSAVIDKGLEENDEVVVKGFNTLPKNISI